MADGVGDDCFVAVMISVDVAVNEGVIVVGRVGVKVETSVWGVEDGVDVISGGVMGFRVETRANMIRRIIPIMPGMTNFQKAGGRIAFALSKGVITGSSPVYPSGDKRFLKLSTYSPLKKLT